MGAYYVTEYYRTVKGVRAKRRYQTQKLTPMHEDIRAVYPGSVTYRVDPTVDWPFGVYKEVVAKS